MSTTGELRWGVKDSFIRYIRVLAAGTVEKEGGATLDDEGEFSWPLARAWRDGDELVLEHSGSVRFTAHGGFLDVDLREPCLRLSGDSGTFSIAGPQGAGRLIIATIAHGEPGTPHEGALVPRLLDAGVEVFGTVYAQGTEFAPLSVTIPVHSS